MKAFFQALENALRNNNSIKPETTELYRASFILQYKRYLLIGDLSDSEPYFIKTRFFFLHYESDQELSLDDLRCIEQIAYTIGRVEQNFTDIAEEDTLPANSVEEEQYDPHDGIVDMTNIYTAENNQIEYEVPIRITKQCNQSCSFCFVKLEKGHQSYSDIVGEFEQTMSKIEKQAKGLYQLRIVLTGGEPTIHPDFWKIIAYLYTLPLPAETKIVVQTNAVLFADEEFAANIQTYKNRLHFTISFHSHREKIYNALTRSKDMFLPAVTGVKNVLEYANRAQVTLNTVLTTISLQDFPEYLDFVQSEFVRTPPFLFRVLRISIPQVSVCVQNVLAFSRLSQKFLVSYDSLIETFNRIDYKTTQSYRFSISLGVVGSPCSVPPCIATRITNPHFFRVTAKWETERTGPRAGWTYGDACKRCSQKQCCVGVSTIYLERYGESEIFPI